MKHIEKHLQELDINLPEPSFPKGSYVPVIIFQGLAFVSGQVPRINNKVPYPGKVDKEVSIHEAKKGAERCVLQAMSYLYNKIGDLNKIESVIKLKVYIQASENFEKHAEVADAASKLLEKIFGKKGEHTRTAIGVFKLPSNSPIEIEFVFAVK